MTLGATKAAMLTALAPEVRCRLRSSVAISTPAQCVEELVLNALDAGSTCVAVRVNLTTGRLQVVDNGVGIPEEQLKSVAERYCTSKCHTVADLDNLCHYGFRGEALASMRDMALMLEVESRHRDATRTYRRVFKNRAEVQLVQSETRRPSAGTTVTVYDLWHSMPVRKHSLNVTLELERVRQRIEASALIHPAVSFSLRNDDTGTKILQTHKSNSVLGSFTHLFGASKARHLVTAQHLSGVFSVEGYLSTEPHHSKSLQHIYINERLVLKSRLHKLVNRLLNSSSLVKRRAGSNSSSPVSPSKMTHAYGVYVLNISCPVSVYDITADPAKTLVEFQDWTGVLGCVQEAVVEVLLREGLLMKADVAEVTDTVEAVTESEPLPGISTSNMTYTKHSSVVCRPRSSSPVESQSPDAVEDIVDAEACSQQQGAEAEVHASPAGAALTKAVPVAQDAAANSGTEQDREMDTESPQFIPSSAIGQVDSPTSTRTDSPCDRNQSSASEVDPGHADAKCNTSVSEIAHSTCGINQADFPSRDTCIAPSQTRSDGTSTQESGHLIRVGSSMPAACSLHNLRQAYSSTSAQTVVSECPIGMKDPSWHRSRSQVTETNQVKVTRQVKHMDTQGVKRTTFDSSLQQLRASHGQGSLPKHPVLCQLQRLREQLRSKPQQVEPIHHMAVASRPSEGATMKLIKEQFRKRSAVAKTGTLSSKLAKLSATASSAGGKVASHRRNSNGFQERQPHVPESGTVQLGIGMPETKMQPSVLQTPEIEPSVPETLEMQPSVPVTLEMQPSVLDTLEMQPSVSETPEMQPSVLETPEMQPTVLEILEMQPSVPETLEMQPIALETPDMRPSVLDTLEMQPSMQPSIQESQGFEPGLGFKLKLTETGAFDPNIPESMGFELSMPESKELEPCVPTCSGFMALDRHQTTSVQLEMDSNQQTTSVHPDLSGDHQTTSVQPDLSGDHQTTSVQPDLSGDHQTTSVQPDLSGHHQTTSVQPDLSGHHQTTSVQPDLSGDHQTTSVQPDLSGDHQTTSVQPDLSGDHQTTSVQPDLSGDHQTTSVQPDICPETSVKSTVHQWQTVTDSSGRQLYVDRVTGNTSYSEPVSQTAGGGGTCCVQTVLKPNALLAHDACSQLTVPQCHPARPLSPASHSSLLGLLQEHADQWQDEDMVKWRDNPQSVSASQTGCGEVAALVNNWQNPVSSQWSQQILLAADNGPSQTHRLLQHHKFTADMLRSLQVLGQVDNKFIVCLINTEPESRTTKPGCADMVVVIDQHAAHERVRLEKLTREAYVNPESTGRRLKASDVTPPIEVTMTRDELRLLKAYRPDIQRIGVEFEAVIGQSDTILVHSVPACLVQREASEARHGRTSLTTDIIQALIREEITLLTTLGGASGTVPAVIHRVLCSQACHGAIKFGDPLTHTQCTELMSALCQCKLPFQCAHGRPAMQPLLSLPQLHRLSDRLVSTQVASRPKLWRLRQT